MAGELMIKLPDRDEMANRLIAVDGDGYKVRNLYPRLLAQAGRSMPVLGFVVFMALAMDDYVEKANTHLPIFRFQMMNTLHLYVTALVDDEAARNAVWDFYEESGIKTGREGGRS